MRRFAKKLALLALTAGMALAVGACEKTRDELQPDMDRVMDGDHGVQCANLREMATQIAPKVLACVPVASSPGPVTVTMLHMENRTEDMPGRNLDIYLAKIESLLNDASTSNKLQFRVTEMELAQLQAQALGGVSRDTYGDAGRTTPPPSAAVPPVYVLHGTVWSMVQGRTTYHLFKFNLTNLSTAVSTGLGSYEVRTLND
jgi:hypothetical protein